MRCTHSRGYYIWRFTSFSSPSALEYTYYFTTRAGRIQHLFSRPSHLDFFSLDFFGIKYKVLVLLSLRLLIGISHFTHMNESCHTWVWVMSHMCMSHVTHVYESCHTCVWVMSHMCMSAGALILEAMGWLRWVGCFKIHVSLQNTGLFCRALLQKRPIFLSILLIVATPYHICMSHPPFTPSTNEIERVILQ